MCFIGTVNEEGEKKILDPSLYLEPHQRFIVSILSRGPSTIQVLQKSIL